MNIPRKVVHAFANSADNGRIYCVCDDGSLWYRSDGGWEQIDNPPDREEPDTPY